MDCESGNLNPYEVNGKAFKIKTHKSDSLFPNTPEYPLSWSQDSDQGPVWHNPSLTRHFCDSETLAVRSSEGRVRYRNFYQTRHTYASLLLSAGENPMGMVSQMGHADWG